jgi:hypothetical protein
MVRMFPGWQDQFIPVMQKSSRPPYAPSLQPIELLFLE